jgi:hypothetical protein
MGRRALAAAVLTLAAAAASADELQLKNGNRLSGIIVGQTTTSVEIEIGAGRVTVPRSIIAKIVTGESPLSVYQTRARALAANDIAGWLELAEWARSRDLSGQARDAYERVLAVDPNNAAARRGLDYERMGDDWLNRDQAMQARGYVWFEGAWVTPVHRDTMLAERASQQRERADSERARLAIAEAEARAREAEARARTAEAEARRAENEQDQQRAFVVGTGVWAWGSPVSPWQNGARLCCNGSHGTGPCPRRNRHDPWGPNTRFTMDLGRSSDSSAEETPTPTPPPPVRHNGAFAGVPKQQP